MNGIDYKKIEFEFGEDWDIFKELIDDYKEALPSFLEQIKTAMDNKEYDALRITAHTLKGIVVNFYCDDLSKTAFELEQCGKNSDLSSASSLYEKLVIINSNVLSELLDYDEKRAS